MISAVRAVDILGATFTGLQTSVDFGYGLWRLWSALGLQVPSKLPQSSLQIRRGAVALACSVPTVFRPLHCKHEVSSVPLVCVSPSAVPLGVGLLSQQNLNFVTYLLTAVTKKTDLEKYSSRLPHSFLFDCHMPRALLISSAYGGQSM